MAPLGRDRPAPPRQAVALQPPASLLPPADAEHTEACQDSGVESASLASEWECPICYQLFVEPVRAGCERHVFCRNCLLKSQRAGTALRCPICRADCSVPATEIPEVAELVDRIRQRDTQYEEKLVVAKHEREEHLMVQKRKRAASLQEHRRRVEEEVRAVRVWIPSPRGIPAREVGGAGMEEVNGIYVPGVLPTYVGPTVYRKPNTHFFIFRWQQTQWAIVELRGPYSMGNERDWLYRAPTQYPPDVPPVHGWEVPAHGRACDPAPEVRIVHNAPAAALGPSMRAPQGATDGRRRSNSVGDSAISRTTSRGGSIREPMELATFASQRWSQGFDGHVEARASCKCTPCAIM